MQRIPLYTIVLTAILLCPVFTYAQSAPQMEYVRAQVEEVSQEGVESVYPVQNAELLLLSGPKKGERISLENEIIGYREDMRLETGQTVVLQRLEYSDGTQLYSFQEHFRLPAMGMLFAAFVLLGLMVGRRRGAMSLLGLCLSILVIVYVMFPLMVAGWNAFLVSVIGSFLIAGSTILIAHGISRRTILALLATYITLICSIVLAVAAVRLTKLFGLGSEESVFLQLDPSSSIDPKGLLLAGIIIGALGLLDDVTTTQVASVDEVQKANPSYSYKKLYAAGMSVGREHVASMINTLVLAYAGASLPLLLMFSIGNDFPLWVTLNSAFLAEEIVRTLVGSMALLLAVPIATLLAVRGFSGRGDLQ